MDNNEQAVVVSGVRGAQKKPFTKRFQDEAAYEKWRDSDASNDYQVDSIMNESAVTMKYYNVYETVDGKKIPFAHKIYSDDKTAIAEGRRIVAESGYRNFSVYESEEISQLDELSPETLGSYTSKAKKDLKSKENMWDRTSKQAKKRHRDMGNRKKGIKTAVNKLTREDDSDNNEKIYAVRTSDKGYVIFGPYDTAREAFADAGPSLEATLRTHEVSRKLRQKLERSGQVTITHDNYKRMVGEQETNEGYKELPPIPDRYDEIPGMEGPFRTLSGHVVYYDPKAGEYYDRDRDMYIDRDEFRAMDNDYSNMKDERDIPVGEGERHGNSKIYDKCWDGYRKVPGKKRGEKGSCVKEGIADFAHHADRDHEVQMARSDLYKLAEYSIKLHNMLKNVSEMEGIQGWQQAKITKAADYISSVYHSLKYDQHTEITEGDVVNFSSYAGMYSDGARATFRGRDGKTHTLTATGDVPRKYYINGKETSWNDVKRAVGSQKLYPRQGMTEAKAKTKPGHNMRVRQRNIDKINQGTKKLKKTDLDIRPGAKDVADDHGFDRGTRVRKPKTNETTTAGGMAAVSKPLGKMQKRRKK